MGKSKLIGYLSDKAFPLSFSRQNTPKVVAEWAPKELYYLEYIDGDLTYHLFLNYRNITREVYRETVTGKCYIAGNIYRFTALAGWRPYKDEWDKFNKETRTMFPYGCRRRPGVCISRRVYYREQLEKALPALKYVWPDSCYHNRYGWVNDLHNIYDFIQILYNHPEMEFVYKSKRLRRWWNDKRIYKLSKEKKKAFMDYCLHHRKKWVNSYDFNEVLYAALNPKATKEQYEHVKNVKLIKKYLGAKVDANYILNRYGAAMKEDQEYYGSKARFLVFYRDYLKMAAELGIKNKYPRDVMKAHDRVAETLRQIRYEKQEKEMNRKIRIQKSEFKGVYDTCLKLAKKVKKDNLTISIPQGYKEFVTLGNQLHNCVGSMGYAGDVRKGKCLIVAVCCDNKPVECCELKPTNHCKSFKIEQLYGDHNSSDGEYHVPARALINTYIKTFRQEVGATL